MKWDWEPPDPDWSCWAFGFCVNRRSQWVGVYLGPWTLYVHWNWPGKLGG